MVTAAGVAAAGVATTGVATTGVATTGVATAAGTAVTGVAPPLTIPMASWQRLVKAVVWAGVVGVPGRAPAMSSSAAPAYLVYKDCQAGGKAAKAAYCVPAKVEAKRVNSGAWLSLSSRFKSEAAKKMVHRWGVNPTIWAFVSRVV